MDQYPNRIIWDIGLIQALIHPEWAKKIKSPSTPENTGREIYLYTHIETETMMRDFWDMLEKLQQPELMNRVVSNQFFHDL